MFINEMNLEDLYNNLFFKNLPKIQHENFEIDNYLNEKSDNRLGITLILRPPPSIISKINLFLKTLQAIEPNQYYYPPSTIHVTVLTIISCHTGFQLNQLISEKYIHLITQSLQSTPPFELSFRGVTISPASVMIQGFFEKGTLDSLRDGIRFQFEKSALIHTIDQRYRLETAHSTVIRFKSKLLKKQAFIDRLHQSRSYHFGDFKVNQLELVINDWYHRQISATLLKKINLLKS